MQIVPYSQPSAQHWFVGFVKLAYKSDDLLLRTLVSKECHWVLFLQQLLLEKAIIDRKEKAGLYPKAWRRVMMRISGSVQRHWTLLFMSNAKRMQTRRSSRPQWMVPQVWFMRWTVFVKCFVFRYVGAWRLCFCAGNVLVRCDYLPREWGCFEWEVGVKSWNWQGCWSCSIYINKMKSALSARVMPGLPAKVLVELRFAHLRRNWRDWPPLRSYWKH